MAEVFGVVAGGIQLADVALRASREAYGFLAAIKDADKDIRALRDALRDVESNVRSLRRYVAEFQKSKCAIEEFEVLSEAVTKSFGGFHADILALKQILPHKPSPSLAEKTKWTYKQRRIQDVTGKLRDRKADLTTALSITGRLHDLRVREDAAAIMKQQALSTSAINKQAEEIEKNKKANEQSHAELIERTRQISTQLDTLRKESQMSQLRRRRQAQDIRAIKKSLQAVSRRDPTCSSLTTSEADLMPNQHSIPSEGSITSSDPQYDTAVREIHSTTTFSASHTDLAAKIIRNELRSSLGSMIEQAHITSESRYEAMTKKMDALIEQISSGFGQGASANESASSNIQSENSDSDRSICYKQPPLQQTKIGPTLNDYGAHVTTSTYRQTWCKSWRIGHLLIQITRTTRRSDASPIATSNLTIHVNFWPNQTFISLPAVALFHSTAPNQEGFYQLAPMINVVPIISWSDRLLDVLYNDNLPLLKHMLATGEIHLRSQNENGVTLLHLAVILAGVKIIHFLVTQGLSWHERTWNDFTPVDVAVMVFFLLEAPPENRISILQLATNQNAGIDQLWWQTRHEAFDLTDYYRTLGDEDIQLCEYIVQNSGDGWHHCCYTLSDIWSLPTKQSLDWIKSMLRKGLNPDQTMIFTKRRPTNLLSWALLTVPAIRKDSQHTFGAFEQGPSSGGTSHDPVELWSIVTALIQGGANIYHIEPHSLDAPGSWTGLRTVLHLVVDWHLGYEWEMALQECGLDLDDVWLENVRQSKQAFRLRGAHRTGFDESVLELPSFFGLRCRRCCRKVCPTGPCHWDLSHENRLNDWIRSTS